VKKFKVWVVVDKDDLIEVVLDGGCWSTPRQHAMDRAREERGEGNKSTRAVKATLIVADKKK